jgi:squalene-associated FAD-dependent desaturase
MEVFYDFCRQVDDTVDEPDLSDAQKQAALQRWREVIQAPDQLSEALSPFEAEILNIARTYDVPAKHFLAIVDGCSMDIGHRRFCTIDELLKYCYGVASAVGLVSVRIFGCTHPATDAYAIALGYALQLTNILRAVAVDYQQLGRVYLPLDELEAFGIQEAELAEPARSEGCRRLLALCHYRCKHWFHRAERLLPDTERSNLKAALVMASVYEALLDKIKASGFQVTVPVVRLSKSHKGRLLISALRNSNPAARQPSQPARVAVWGGGIAGMAAAVEAGYLGDTPLLIEQRSRLGGRAHSLQDTRLAATLDNGQHIIMGCYSAFFKLLERLQVADRFEALQQLEVPYVDQRGQRSVLGAAKAPAPLHLLLGLANFDELSAMDRASILWLGTRLRLGHQPTPEETAEPWLKRMGQTAGALRALWEPFCIAALNEPLETASATLLHATLKRSLFGNARDSRIFTAKQGFSEVFEPEVALYLKAIGGELHLGSGIEGLKTAEDPRLVSELVLNSETTVCADRHICALNWSALGKLLPERANHLKQRLSGLVPAPIICLHLLTPTRLFEAPSRFIGLLDSPLHWVFDRTETLPEAHAGKCLYSLVISAATQWVQLPSDAIVQRVREALEKAFPQAGPIVIDDQRVFKWKEATFSARPASEPLRPGVSEAPWDNVALAGDWTATGLPATLESAAQSGQVAAHWLVDKTAST